MSVKEYAETLNKGYKNLIDPTIYADKYDINFIEERITIDKRQIITYKGKELYNELILDV